MDVEDNTTQRFTLSVDSDNKSTTFCPFFISKPHMRAFHLAWFQFFCCFVSTFAAPPLLPIIRENLNLTSTDIGNAGIASVSGSIFARLIMGAACDLFGPRLASAALTLSTAPAVYFTAAIDSSTSFILVRFFAGFSLATFVSTQFWMSSMFSGPVVGRANAFSAGWGNVGGGVTQLLMPLVFLAVKKLGATEFMAWRIAFFVPALFQTLSAFVVLLFGQDLPEGDYWELHKSGEKTKDNVKKVINNGITNYRGWITALAYGYCFGIELTVDNIIAEYFFDKFYLNLSKAGFIAASFGLVNSFARPLGGYISDKMAKRFGMRGRLWSWWIVQTLGGVLCACLGQVSSLAGSIVVMLIFSIFVQAACGLTFGIIPFVSRRSLGLISGMTGAGGNIGSVLTQLLFFKGSTYSREKGITLMGIMTIACSLPICFIHFPQWGGMFCGPSSDNVTEVDYYLSEWNSEEKDKNLHLSSQKFAENSVSERGRVTTHPET